MKKTFVLAVLLFCVMLLAACGGKQGEVNSTQGQAGASQGEGGAAQEAEQKNVEAKTFRIVSFLPANHLFTRDVIPMWMEKVEQETGGEVKLEWAGGPESIPSGDQFDAVRNGVIDINFSTSSFYGHLMPETLSLHLSPYSPAEEREKGYFDYLSGRFAEQGLVYLGRWLSPSNQFHFWSNKEIKTLEDFKGMTFRSNPTYHDILQALGVTPIEIPPSDVYTALERGMVDGFGFPLLGPREDGWTEVTKYFIDEPFLNQNGTILMNAKAFQSISPENQQKLLELTAEFEAEMIQHFDKINEQERQAITDAGVSIIKLAPEDSKQFQELVTRVKWESMEKSAPDQVEELKRLLLNK
jgi:TRAP-type C4-dicarboxylate transport system substrate-binding protein